MTTPSQERERLKPCPWCGEQPQQIKANGGTWNGGLKPPQPPVSYDVMHWCPKVDGQPSPRPISRCGKTEADAIAAWNTRPAERDTLSARVAELEGVLAALMGRVMAIYRLARSDGNRAFDDTIRDGLELGRAGK